MDTSSSATATEKKEGKGGTLEGAAFADPGRKTSALAVATVAAAAAAAAQGGTFYFLHTWWAAGVFFISPLGFNWAGGRCRWQTCWVYGG